MMKDFLYCCLLVVLATTPVATAAHTSDAKLVNATVTGLGGIGRDFEFLDSNGKLRHLADLHGNVVAVFFGFTNCPDACPALLAKANAVRELLGSDRDRFKVVFVTIDPQRDTRTVLNNYLTLFNSDFISARIPGGNLPKLTRDFAISNQVVQDANGQVSISHSVGVFLFDRQGQAKIYLSGSKKVKEFHAEVSMLLGTEQ